MPHPDELGPFPQFYLHVNSDDGNFRRDLFSETEALRLTSLYAAMLTHQTFQDPFPSGPNLGYSLAGDPERITSIHLYRVDNVAELEALPSMDE